MYSNKLLTAFSAFLLICTCIFIGCKKSSDDATTTTTTTTTTPSITYADASGLPAPYNKIYGASQIYVSGSNIVIKTQDFPDHKSPYFQSTQWESTKYEAYNGGGAFSINPNRIALQTITFTIPMNPTVDASHPATPLGPIGVAINGVPLFNQYAGPSQPLTSEIISFDQYAGHPQQTGQYHYHVEPLWITANKGKDALLGFLLDGYAVYGPKENGVTLTTANLDAYHGHFSATADYPLGVYHYHVTADAPYINGSGFYGVKGTVTQ